MPIPIDLLTCTLISERSRSLLITGDGLIEWIDYTIGFVDGYKYPFRIMSMTVEDNSHTAVGALEIVNQLDVILREPIVENMMSENSSRHHD